MRRTVFKSKIHRATVTAADLHYEGSITVDQDLLDAADILPFEQVHVWDVTNGTRLVTYALSGARGSGEIQVNGAGAHLIKTGDLVIIATFTEMRTKEAKRYEPTVVFVDDHNKIKDLTDDDDAADVPAEPPPTSHAPTPDPTAEVEAEPAAASAPTRRVKRK